VQRSANNITRKNRKKKQKFHKTSKYTEYRLVKLAHQSPQNMKVLVFFLVGLGEGGLRCCVLMEKNVETEKHYDF